MGEARRRAQANGGQQPQRRAAIFESIRDALARDKISGYPGAKTNTHDIGLAMMQDELQYAVAIDAGTLPVEHMMLREATRPGHLELTELWLEAGAPLPGEIGTLVCFADVQPPVGTMRVGMFFHVVFPLAQPGDDPNKFPPPIGMACYLLLSLNNGPWEIQPSVIMLREGKVSVIEDADAPPGTGPMPFVAMHAAALLIACEILRQLGERRRETVEPSASGRAPANDEAQRPASAPRYAQDVRIIDLAKPIKLTQAVRFDAPGTGSPKSPHMRMAHKRFLKRSQRWVDVRAGRIHGGGPSVPIVLQGLRP